jgi:hypothetical protein
MLIVSDKEIYGYILGDGDDGERERRDGDKDSGNTENMAAARLFRFNFSVSLAASPDELNEDRRSSRLGAS